MPSSWPFSSIEWLCEQPLYYILCWWFSSAALVQQCDGTGGMPPVMIWDDVWLQQLVLHPFNGVVVWEVLMTWILMTWIQALRDLNPKKPKGEEWIPCFSSNYVIQKYSVMKKYSKCCSDAEVFETINNSFLMGFVPVPSQWCHPQFL